MKIKHILTLFLIILNFKLFSEFKILSVSENEIRLEFNLTDNNETSYTEFIGIPADGFITVETQPNMPSIISINEAFNIGFNKIQSFTFTPFALPETINKAFINIYIHGNTKDHKIAPKNDFLSSIILNYHFANNWLIQNNYRNNEAHKSRYSHDSFISEIKLSVIEDGIYKVTYEDLKQQMNTIRIEHDVIFAWDIDFINPKYIEISNKGKPVPIHFVGENDNSFDPGDYFEFWGEKLSGTDSYYHPYSDKNIYSLSILNQLGSRMAVENGGLLETNHLLVTTPDAYDQTIHFERQLIPNRLSNQVSQNNLDFQKEDLLFWKSITAPALNMTPFNLEYPINSTSRLFYVKASIWGLTFTNNNNLDHQARIWVNSALINDLRWSNQNEQIFTNQTGLGNFNLVHGTNNFIIDLSGDTPMGNRQQVLFDYFSINYWREYKTDTNYLRFNKPSTSGVGLYQFELHNFTRNDVSIYKIGNSVFSNITVESYTDLMLPPYIVKFQNYINTEGVEFVALTEDMKKNVYEFKPDIPSDLKNPWQQADYLIVTNHKLANAEGTLLLKNFWQARNVNVKIIDVQDIYDEFNHGIVSPLAIKDFFRFAFSNWQEPRFTHVLLLGDGIFDRRNQSDIDNYDIIPIYNIWTYLNGATPSDNWYACIIGDNPIPDFHISRICVIEEHEILPIAQKSIQYIENRNFNDKWNSNITLVAGGKVDDPTDIFAQQNERIRRNYMPIHYQANRVYTTVNVESPHYLGRTPQLIERINDGTSYLQFMGHGGGQIWADYDLLLINDVKSLINRNYPFVVSLSCFAAAFETRGINSIGEVFIAEPNKGAIAHFGFSGLGYIAQIEDSGNYLADAFFNKRINTFGEIATYHKIMYYANHRNHHSWLAHVQAAILMGDPMLYSVITEHVDAIVLNKHFVEPGETINISANFDYDITEARVLILNELEIPVNIPINTPIIQGKLEYNYIIPENDEIGKRDVKIIASGSNREIVSMSSFAIGKSIFIDNKVLPAFPTEKDSLKFIVKLIPDNYITNVTLSVKILNQIRNYNTTFNSYTGFYESDYIPALASGTNITYYFTTENDEKSEDFSVRILAPDLALLTIELTEKDNIPGLEAFIQNIGDIASELTTLDLKQSSYLFYSVDIMPLQPNQAISQFIPLPENIENVNFTIVVNELGNHFGEYSLLNNVLNYRLNYSFFKAGAKETLIKSFDNNLDIFIPENFLPYEAWFSLKIDDFIPTHQQPDVQPVTLSNGLISQVYKIDILNKSLLADSTGVFSDNKRIKLTFRTNDDDVSTQNAIYRYDFNTMKWIFYESFNQNNEFIADINKIGTYSLIKNNDTNIPRIDINVDGQIFTFGGYISQSSVLSFIFSDENGIDITENKIVMMLNNEPVQNEQLTMAVNNNNTNTIPLKYHLDLKRGEYSLQVTCWNVNGNKNERTFDFKVSDRFDLIRVANYPNPVRSVTIDPVNSGRTRFTYTLTDDADTVNIRVYTVSGRLVKSFRNLPAHVGYHEFPRSIYGWDCTDEEGFQLANGVYFYRISARKGNKEIVKTNRLAILK